MSQINRSVRTIDLRLAIADDYGFLDEFQKRISKSASNSLAAIYFHRSELELLAEDLGIDTSQYAKPELLDEIRRVCGCKERSVDGLDWSELRRVIDELDIKIASDVYYETGQESQEPESASADQKDVKGIWADWNGGDS